MIKARVANNNRSHLAKCISYTSERKEKLLSLPVTFTLNTKRFIKVMALNTETSGWSFHPSHKDRIIEK